MVLKCELCHRNTTNGLLIDKGVVCDICYGYLIDGAVRTVLHNGKRVTVTMDQYRNIHLGETKGLGQPIPGPFEKLLDSITDIGATPAGPVLTTNDTGVVPIPPRRPGRPRKPLVEPITTETRP